MSDAKSIKEQIIENQKVIDELNGKLLRKTQEVKIIQQISSEIMSSLDLDRILDSILLSMESVLGFKHSMILLSDKTSGKLKVVACRGYDGCGIGMEISLGQGLIGVVAKRRTIMRMGNIGSQVSYLSSVKSNMALDAPGQVAPSLPGLKNVQSQIGIPLVIKDRLIGVLAVESEKPGAFDELDEVLLTILGSQAATAIDNARLYKEEEERLKEINEVNRKLSALNDTLEEKIRDRTKDLSRAVEEINKEKSVTEELLKRMAPQEVIPLMVEDKLLAKRLNVSILFADIVGFTRASSGLEPDEIFSQLNYFFSKIGEIVHNYHGYINKTIGDSVMALFGVPFEDSNHYLNAVLCALEMQKEVKQSFPFEIRVGVNTGIITAGMLGPKNKSLYDVLGDAVNIASRIEQNCPPGSVAITEDAFKLVRQYFSIEPLGEQEIKGKGAMSIFRVAGIRRLSDDPRRVNPKSVFYNNYLNGAEDFVEKIKKARLQSVDFLSIQAHDGAILHNESVACYALSLVRYLKSAKAKTEVLNRLGEIAEDSLVAFALLHDIGKYAVDSETLNATDLDSDGIDGLRRDIYGQTASVLKKLGLEQIVLHMNNFYEYEKNRSGDLISDGLTSVVALADVYDALTAPKIYKGKSWSINGTLVEISRMTQNDVYLSELSKYFIELMRGDDSEIVVKSRDSAIFR